MRYAPLLLLPTLLLASCHGQNTPTVTTYTSTSGTVRELGTPGANDMVAPTTAWTGGAGTIQATVADAGTQGATSASLASNGTFTLPLPTNVKTRSLSSDEFTLPGSEELGCAGTPTVSDPAARFAVLNVNVSAGKQGPVDPVRISFTGTVNAPTGLSIESGAFLYADRPVSITGTQTCTLTESGETYTLTSSLNMTLGQGWNKVTATEIISDSGASLNLTSGTFPTEEWVYLDGSALTSAAVHRAASKLPAGLKPFKFSDLR
ncbi:hypothetical protein [uncultured Deinococcus sp.]|uniref:hypothetical protein n=1 Tax=uncultured Deinococcus sp. TaxID=158789 RepID=UPI002583EA98|nr:hypothetical protein [uncultured Deinococcus sp.]